MDEELERFKTQINLTAYMAEQGYAIDRKESSRNSAVMRHENGDKLIVARGHDGHWIYFSVRDDQDNGSIIDFIQRRRPCSLGHVRQALRQWTGSARPIKARAQTYAPELERTSKDRLAVMGEFARMKPAGRHPYLEHERCIPADILQSPRFAGKIHIDSRNNAVFAHYDTEGLCGLEIKNRNFTGFPKGGTKGLWFSVAMKDDTRLVFAESAIDALSYHALHPDEHARYASIGGEMNPNQPKLVKRAIEKMPEKAEIIIATDADPPGRELAERIRQIAQEAGRHNVICHEPPEEGADWNDQLRASAGNTGSMNFSCFL